MSHFEYKNIDMYPVKLIFSKNFTLSLIAFLILFHNTANSYPEELNRDKIIEKLSKAFLKKAKRRFTLQILGYWIIMNIMMIYLLISRLYFSYREKVLKQMRLGQFVCL